MELVARAYHGKHEQHVVFDARPVLKPLGLRFVGLEDEDAHDQPRCWSCFGLDCFLKSRHGRQRFGSAKFFDAKNVCSDSVNSKSFSQSTHFKVLSGI
jgi:hypothetical protein